MIGNLFKNFEVPLYVLFRAAVGCLFMEHGLQKLGLLGGAGKEFFSLMWFIGVCELLGGLAVMVGALTRLASLCCAVLMLLAYFVAHAGQGFWPILNKGELSLLYLVAFLVITVYGARKWSVDEAVFKKEIF